MKVRKRGVKDENLLRMEKVKNLLEEIGETSKKKEISSKMHIYVTKR